ncbi:prolipoprotein diacylglyceryl transferase [Pseudochryseolinea flava]|uniref:Phosphatidylglycerol--prolipoprotein diacylglyceryl transferase n=1 Tax=Pseudochryseolinea flava TaxID=2059302 RepID=A0A364Y4X9_9BACT|nr:prolipoprotein diacylglyceryl transferase [Pseudochryseolinea flava]RAW01836.1 prolipoprotein diacylglyceryl transferase [Pseudochryseolinea flava]
MISYITWNITPEVVDGFPLLRWYGVSWIAGMFLAYKILTRIYKSEGTPLVELDSLTTYVVLCVIVGARLGHILFYDPIYYWNNPIEILPFKLEPEFEFTGFLGLASHGGIAGALVALGIYGRKFKKNYWWLLDRIVIAGPALGIIRLGNLMNSEIVGIPTNLPWAFIFTRIDTVPRHPVQLYEAICYLGISGVLYMLWRSKKFYEHNGFIAGLGITLLFIERFLIEFLKEDQVSFEQNLLLNMGQLLSIPLILGGIVLMVTCVRGIFRFENNSRF